MDKAVDSEAAASCIGDLFGSQFSYLQIRGFLLNALPIPPSQGVIPSSRSPGSGEEGRKEEDGTQG